MVSKRPVDITLLQAINIKRSRTAAPQAITAVVTIEGHGERFVTNPAYGEDPVWKARHMFFIEEELVSGDEPSDIRVELYDSPQLENHIGTATINLETAMDFYNKAHAYKLMADGKPQGSVTVAVSVAPRSKSPLLTPSTYSTPPLYGPPLPGEPVVINQGQQNPSNSSARGQNGYLPPPSRSQVRPQSGPPADQPRNSSGSHGRGTASVPAVQAPLPPRGYRPSPYTSAPHNTSPPPATVEANGYQGYLSIVSGQSPQRSPQDGGYGQGYSQYNASHPPHYSPQGGPLQGSSSTSPGYMHQSNSSYGQSSSAMMRISSDSALNRQGRGRRHNGEREMDMGGMVEGALIGAAAGFIVADIIDDDF